MALGNSSTCCLRRKRGHLDDGEADVGKATQPHRGCCNCAWEYTNWSQVEEEVQLLGAEGAFSITQERQPRSGRVRAVLGRVGGYGFIREPGTLPEDCRALRSQTGQLEHGPSTFPGTKMGSFCLGHVFVEMMVIK